MALNGKTISAGVLDILNIDGGVDTTSPRNIKDGDGTVTPLWLTTTRLGIGESSPDTVLHIKDTSTHCMLKIEASADTYDPKIMFTSNGGDQWQLIVDESDSNKFKFFDEANDATRVTILQSGSVGIGTTTPDTHLHIKGTTAELLLEENSTRFLRFNTRDDDMEIGWDDGDELVLGVFATTTDSSITPLVKISNDGKVGIGTTNPSDRFHVADDTATNYVAKFEHTEAGGSADPRGIRIDFASDLDNSDDYFFLCKGASTTKMTVRGDGDVFTVDDSILSSDRDMKENIVDASPKLDDLLKLKVRNFNWKSQYKPDSSKKIGFIAQEVEEVFPALVREHLSPIESEANAGVMRKEIKQSFIPILVKAIQELTAKVTALENA